MEVAIIEDSISPSGVRLTTFRLRYWRAIHAELMTHRVFSRNASSSRAIPVKKVISQVWNTPAMPVYWGANQSGMQASQELGKYRKSVAKFLWRTLAKGACIGAWSLMKLGLHKQVANRILEPWQYINVIVTATEWDNFFTLRCHKDAQPEIQLLAGMMRQAMRTHNPIRLDYGEWHLPFVTPEERKEFSPATLVKLSTARCARVSYTLFDGTKPSIDKDLDLHDRLVVAEPMHASPAEHQATPIHGDGFCRNFRGWRQYRDFLESGDVISPRPRLLTKKEFEYV